MSPARTATASRWSQRTSATRRVPGGVSGRAQVRVEAEVDTRAVTIVERRPPWREDFGREWTRSPIARLRYVQRTGV